MSLPIVTPHNLKYTEYVLPAFKPRDYVLQDVIMALVHADNDKDVIDSFRRQANMGNYGHFMRVVLAFTSEPDDDYDFRPSEYNPYEQPHDEFG